MRVIRGRERACTLSFSDPLPPLQIPEFRSGWITGADVKDLPDRKDWVVEVKWECSILLYLVRIANNLFAYISAVRLTWRLLRRFGIDWQPWWVEVWLVFLLAALFGCLFWGSVGNHFIWWAALYILMDATGATLRDITTPLHKGGVILVYNRVRWLLLVPVNIVQVTLCFAAFALYYGEHFKPTITDGSTAIYFSAVTISTLGYGDVRPLTWQGQVLVSCELLAFLLFLAIKLPIAVAVIKVKEEPEGWL